jgi:hypothetical protein
VCLIFDRINGMDRIKIEASSGKPVEAFLFFDLR